MARSERLRSPAHDRGQPGGRRDRRLYDGSTRSLDLTTTALEGGFAGATATLHLGFDDYYDGFETACDAATGFLALGFGNTDAATLAVQ